jgi:hypothetical protein
VANLFVALVVARILAETARAHALSLALCAFLLIEQINLVWPPTMSRRAALNWIDGVPTLPASCIVFYVAPDGNGSGRSAPQLEDDAMLFAEIRGIPTVNGYSSWFPQGWALDEPARPGYATAVRDWAQRKGIAQGLCGLELRTGRWIVGMPVGMPE